MKYFGPAGVLFFTALCLAGQIHTHVDDSDAQLYTVVVRNMVRDGTWVDLSYLPNVHPKFREHLPFGLWPSAAVARLLGEPALPWLSSLWTLLTVALVMELGRRLDGEALGILAGLILATTEQFIFFGARHRLDPPLVFFSLLAAAPFLVGRRGWGGFALATLASALGCGIKGPFGLVMPVAAAAARALVDKDSRWLLWGAFSAGLATLPVLGFLLVDYGVGGDWWNGYGQAQLLASATGERTDGRGLWVPLAAIGSRFWPWLPLLFLALWQAKMSTVRHGRLLVFSSLVALAILFLPHRKLWHHVLVLFPTLSLLTAAGLVKPVHRWMSQSIPQARVLVAVVALCLAALVMSWGGWLSTRRAVTCTDFATTFAAQSSGSTVLVSRQAWREISTLAAEYRLIPWMVDVLPTGSASEMSPVNTARLALMADGTVPESDTAPWHAVQRARGWTLWSR